MKYAAVLLNAIGVCMLGSAVVAVTRPQPAPVKPAVPANAAGVDRAGADLDAARRSLAAVESLRRSLARANDGGPSNLIAQPVARSTQSAAGPDLPQRQLTLLLETLEERRAVVDGRLVRAGDRLPHGGRVVRLRDDRVLLAEKQGRQTLAMPLARLRIGTVTTLAKARGSDADRDAGTGSVAAAGPQAGASAALAAATAKSGGTQP